MTGIASLPSANKLMEHVYKTQTKLNDLQTQLASGQASQSYAGVGPGAERLVRMENIRDLNQRFVDNNQAMDLRLKSTETTLSSVQKTVEDFRQSLLDFGAGATDDPTRVKDIQDAAFKQLKSLEGLLNTEFDGRFLFAGSRVTTEPVDLGLTSLADFQKTFDGNAVTVPTTRNLHLGGLSLSGADTGDLTFDRESGTIQAANADSLKAVPVGAAISIGGASGNDGVFTVAANDGTTITVRSEKLAADEGPGGAVITPSPGITLDFPTGDLSFDEAAGTITAANADTLAAIPEGSTFTVTGSTAVPSNDGTYTVGSNDGTTITIASRTLQDGSLAAPHDATITVNTYYQGDDLDPSHRLDAERSFSQDLNASHPAFEKAIRAMKLVAQGAFGTEGGLDKHPERIDQALYLLNGSAERLVEGKAPFGPEAAGNLEDVQMQVGLQRVMIADANKRMKSLIGSLDGQVAKTEVIDRTQVATQLFDQANALEASLTTIARVRQLSLVKFL